MKVDGDYFWLDIPNLETGTEYAFQYYIDGEITIADPYTEKILDPWNDVYIADETYPNLKAYPVDKAKELHQCYKPGKLIILGKWKFYRS